MSNEILQQNHLYCERPVESIEFILTENASCHSNMIQNLICELSPFANVWRALLSFLIGVLFGLVVVLFISVIPLFEYSQAGVFMAFSYLSGFYLLLFAFLLVIGKKLADFRYLIFQKKTIFICSRNRIKDYSPNQIKLHILKIETYVTRYSLELEILDESLPAKDRMILLALSPSLESIKHRAAKFSAALRGEEPPFIEAKKSWVESLELKPLWSWPWRMFWKFESYFTIAVFYVLPTKLLFWTVHGSAKRALKKVTF